jgi:hypothetical protein
MIEVSRRRRKHVVENAAVPSACDISRAKDAVSRESSPTRRFPRNGREIAVFMNQNLFL